MGLSCYIDEHARDPKRNLCPPSLALCCDLRTTFSVLCNVLTHRVLT